MFNVATITSKGQLTVPKRIRDALGLKTYSKVVFQLQPKTNLVIIKPVKSFLSLRGSVKGRKYSDQKADKKILEAVACQYGQENS